MKTIRVVSVWLTPTSDGAQVQILRFAVIPGRAPGKVQILEDVTSGEVSIVPPGEVYTASVAFRDDQHRRHEAQAVCDVFRDMGGITVTTIEGPPLGPSRRSSTTFCAGFYSRYVDDVYVLAGSE